MSKKNILGYLLIALAIGIVAFQYYRYRVAPSIAWNELSLKEVNGSSYQINFHNQQTTAVCFFATWCGECLTEFSEIEAGYNNNKGYLNQITFIAITDESDDKIKSFLLNHPYPHIKLLKANQKISGELINAFPTNYLIDKNGKVLFKKVGSIHWNDQQEINTILERN